MKVVWIGAGNLATRLGAALKVAGHETLQVYSRTMESAAALAERLGCPATDRLEEVNRTADVYIFSVKDSALDGLVARVAPTVGAALCLHTAGSMPLDVFRGRAVRYGVLYPMQTFSRSREVCFREVPCFVEASDEEALSATMVLASSISGRVEVMSTGQRAYLHLAAVFACNFANHCYALSAAVLEKQGIPFEVMLPLIDETARKVHDMCPCEAQTGPAVRFDENVIGRHVAMLDDDGHLNKVYEMMSRSIHETAQEKKEKEG